MVDRDKFLEQVNTVFNLSIFEEKYIPWNYIFSAFPEELLIDFFEEFVTKPCTNKVDFWSIDSSSIEFASIWDNISSYCDCLSDGFIEKFKVYLRWDKLSATKSIHEFNADKFWNFIVWSEYIKTHFLTQGFIMSHIDKLDPGLVLKECSFYLPSDCCKLLEDKIHARV